MSIKKILMIIGIVYVLVGCIFGGFWAYNNLRSPPIFEFNPDAREDPKAKKKAKKKDAPEPDLKDEAKKREDALRMFLEFPYFRLPMIIVPVVRDGRVYAFLHLHIAMKATGDATFKRAKVLLPRLVDAIYSDLYVSFSNLWNMRSDPKSSVIKERIFAVTEKVLGHKHIDTIHFREFIFKRTVTE